MGDQAVEVRVAWSLHIEIPLADVVDCFVVDHERAVGVLESGMSGQHAVVWLHDSCRNLSIGKLNKRKH